MNKYTNVSMHYHRLAFRGIENGKRIREIVDYTPSLFTTSKQPTKWRTHTPPKEHGKPNDQIFVERIKFTNIKEAREFLKNNGRVSGLDLYGHTRYNYTFIADHYKDTSNFDHADLSIAYIDIEVGSESGFPKPSEASEPVTAITVYLSDQDTYYVFGCGDYKKHKQNIKYIKCSNEEELLNEFMLFWVDNYPDIVTGWNTQFFDIPYLYNRIHKIIGITKAEKMSPWKNISKRNIRVMQNDHEVFDIVGIDGLDYLDLYKHFSGKSDHENYKLNTIASYELGVAKLDYSEYSSLHKLYLNDYQKFIEYNVQDVELLVKLENKLHLIKMAVMIAYRSKVNFQDVFSQVLMWDMIIFSHFLDNNLVVPMIDRNNIDTGFRGAFVKEPVPGMYEWVVSYDLDSLYPNIIIQFNISPDTIIQHGGQYQDFTIDKVKQNKIDSNFLKQNKLTVAGNGQLFTTNKQGFLPSIIEPMYLKRKEVKQQMIASEEFLAKIDREILSRGLKL